MKKAFLYLVCVSLVLLGITGCSDSSSLKNGGPSVEQIREQLQTKVIKDSGKQTMLKLFGGKEKYYDHWLDCMAKSIKEKSHLKFDKNNQIDFVHLTVEDNKEFDALTKACGAEIGKEYAKDLTKK